MKMKNHKKHENKCYEVKKAMKVLKKLQKYYELAVMDVFTSC